MDLARLKTIYHMYQNKAYVDAEIGIRGLLNQNSNNSDALRLGALTALSLNQVVTAEIRLKKATQFCQMTAEMANTLGNIKKAAGEWSQSEAAYKQAVALDPDYEPVRANYIDLLIVSGQAKRAYDEVKRQVALCGPSDFLHFASASALLHLGKYEQALRASEEISEALEPAKLAKLKLQLYFHLGRYEDMRNRLEAIPFESPHAVESLALAVNAYAMQDDWETGLKIIKGACEAPNAQAAIFVKSIELLMRGGLVTEAQKLREETQARLGNHVDILAENARRFLKQGQFSESCELYKEALAMRPADYSMMIHYAQACLGAGQYDMCQNLIQGALQQAPNSQLLFALAATLQRKRGEEYKSFYDYEQFIQVYDLPPPEGYDSIEVFNAALKDSLERYHNFKSEPLNQSLRKGIQTDTDLSVIDDPVLKSFFDLIDAPVLDYMRKIGNDAHHPLTRRNTNKYRINGAWSVKLSAQGHHVNHVHPMGWISSSYYVDVPDVVQSSEGKQGWIKFGEPDIPGLELEAEKYVEPKGGRLVLFPSYMWHGTIPFSGPQTRLTLPFDVVPA